MKTLSVALAVWLALSLTSFVEAKQTKKQAKPAPTADQWRASGLNQQPARMIEVKPGYWISSYGCVQDEGYGRLTPCDLPDGNAR